MVTVYTHSFANKKATLYGTKSASRNITAEQYQGIFDIVPNR